MNTFELKIVIVPPEETHGGVPCVTQEIWIDGQHLDEPFPVDLRRLVNSLFSPGPCYVFTCGCGDPGCAEIWEGFDIRHEPGKIRWRFRRPVSAGDMQILDVDERIQYWRERATIVEYQFDRELVCAALREALALALTAPEEAEFSPYGMDRDALAALSTYHHPPAWDEPQGRRHLYFLADEACPWFLEGHFVSPDSLGLAQSSLNALQACQLRGHRDPLDPAFRLSWLEEARQLLLSTYLSGLPADIDLKLVARLPDKSEGLSFWEFDIRDLDRSFLDIESPLEAPYLCLSAGRYGFELWLDETSEVKDYRAGFLGNGTKVLESILVPFQLERELYEWACLLADTPRNEDRDPVALWDFDEPQPAPYAEIRDWEGFHQRGLQLAEQLQAIVGGRAKVLYEMSSIAPAAGKERRFAITGGVRPA